MRAKTEKRSRRLTAEICQSGSSEGRGLQLLGRQGLAQGEAVKKPGQAVHAASYRLLQHRLRVISSKFVVHHALDKWPGRIEDDPNSGHDSILGVGRLKHINSLHDICTC